MHSLWASMRSPHSSSPRSTIHVSRAFLVSGHAQHGLHFCVFSPVSAVIVFVGATGVVGGLLVADPIIIIQQIYLRSIERYSMFLFKMSCNVYSESEEFYRRLFFRLLFECVCPLVHFPAPLKNNSLTLEHRTCPCESAAFPHRILIC